MAPTPNPSPAPEPLNPIGPIQDNWDTINPWLGRYNKVLGGLGTVFSFASAIALIASHKFQPPKWPFTQERWNPKPNVDGGEKKEEVTEEQIIEDELAEVAAGAAVVGKRSLAEADLDWIDLDFLSQADLSLEKRGGLDDIIDEIQDTMEEIGEDLKNATETAVEKGKEIYEDIKPGIDEIAQGAEEIGDKIWDDVTDVFDHHKNKTRAGNNTESGSPQATAGRNKTRRAFKYREYDASPL